MSDWFYDFNNSTTWNDLFSSSSFYGSQYNIYSSFYQYDSGDTLSSDQYDGYRWYTYTDSNNSSDWYQYTTANHQNSGTIERIVGTYDNGVQWDAHYTSNGGVLSTKTLFDSQNVMGWSNANQWYDNNGNLYRETGALDNGMRWDASISTSGMTVTYSDVFDASDVASFTQYKDAAGNLTSETGTWDNGDTYQLSVGSNGVWTAREYDTINDSGLSYRDYYNLVGQQWQTIKDYNGPRSRLDALCTELDCGRPL